MHTKTKKAKSCYAKETKQKRFSQKKKKVSVGLQQRAWYKVLISLSLNKNLVSTQ